MTQAASTFTPSSGAYMNTAPKKPMMAAKPLRKGKWTAEEEEYTARIIEFFNTGLLTLPEGTTLRAYLSEKLHCDPMRITKKFTGASCLGKRVYHSCERNAATMAEVEAANMESHALEARFWGRLERTSNKSLLPGGGLIEFDTRYTNPTSIISTPAIDAMLYHGGRSAAPVPTKPSVTNDVYSWTEEHDEGSEGEYAPSLHSESSAGSYVIGGSARQEAMEAATTVTNSSSPYSPVAPPSTYLPSSSSLSTSSSSHNGWTIPHQDEKQQQHDCSSSGRIEPSSNKLRRTENGKWPVRDDEEHKASSSMTSLFSVSVSTAAAPPAAGQHEEKGGDEEEVDDGDAGAFMGLIGKMHRSGSHPELTNFMVEVHQKTAKQKLEKGERLMKRPIRLMA